MHLKNLLKDLFVMLMSEEFREHFKTCNEFLTKKWLGNTGLELQMKRNNLYFKGPKIRALPQKIFLVYVLIGRQLFMFFSCCFKIVVFRRLIKFNPPFFFCCMFFLTRLQLQALETQGSGPCAPNLHFRFQSKLIVIQLNRH